MIIYIYDYMLIYDYIYVYDDYIYMITHENIWQYVMIIWWLYDDYMIIIWI